MMPIGPALLRHSPDGAPSSGHARLWLFAALLTAMAQANNVSAAPEPVMETGSDTWARVPIGPGPSVTTRPFPPKEGRNRCISVDGLAGAQLFGDRAIELSMHSGQHYRLFLARECPALSFYQGFYYRRQRAGQLCAGRDVIGARSGGECPIASIIAVRSLNGETKGKTSGRKRKR
jgi:hypothetical protein